MSFDKLIISLSDYLSTELPGHEAQLKMAPKPVDLERFMAQDKSQYRAGSVMILLYPHEDKIVFPLMQRPQYEGVHSGQVSLPGGKVDKEDKSLVDTAIRETREEIGVSVPTANVIGQLTEMFIPPSKFRVSPMVAYMDSPLQMQADKREVVELFSVSIQDLLNEQIRKETTLDIRGMKLTTPYFDLHGKIVWGATAMILSEFSEILKQLK